MHERVRLDRVMIATKLYSDFLRLEDRPYTHAHVFKCAVSL